MRVVVNVTEVSALIILGDYGQIHNCSQPSSDFLLNLSIIIGIYLFHLLFPLIRPTTRVIKMAPFLKILIKWVPYVPSTLRTSSPVQSTAVHHSQPQQPIGRMSTQPGQIHDMKSNPSTISSVSWTKDRLDIFGYDSEHSNLTHKFWDGKQWNPAGSKLEILGTGLTSPPLAVTWGPDRLDVFGFGSDDTIKHQYWDGTAWKPSHAEFENLGEGCNGNFPIAATTWGQHRLDIFCLGWEGELLHQYYDGSQWTPDPRSMESLGGPLGAGPSVVSWGKDRLDIFTPKRSGGVEHLYWDGSQWSEWETLGTDVELASLTASSWGEQRLDIFGVDTAGFLSHMYWDGSRWSEWESLGHLGSQYSAVAVTSWSANRFDVVARLSTIGPYRYKFYDGSSWQPDTKDWIYKGGPGFFSSPSVVSWAENRLDIVGETFHGEWLHQAWTGDSWHPSNTDWEYLNGRFEDRSSGSQRPLSGELRY